MSGVALYPRLKPADFRIQTLTIICASIAINILALGLPIVSRQIYDRVLREHNEATLTVLIFGICVVVVLEAVLRLIRSYLVGLNGASFVHNLSRSAVSQILASPFYSVRSSGLAEAIDDLGAIRRIKEFHNGHALTVAVDFMFLPIFLWLIYHIGGLVVLVPLGVLAVFLSMSRYQGQWLTKTTQDRRTADNDRYSFLIQTLKAIHSVKALALEPNLTRQYESLQEASSRSNYGVARVTLSSYVNSTILSHILTVAVVGVSAYLVTQGQLTLGGVIAIVLLSGRLLQPVQQGLQLWLQYQNFKQSESHARRLFRAAPVDEAATRVPDSDTGSADLINVSFRYTPDTPLLLDNISLSLRKGTAVALHGEAGSGKSTLLKLVAGMQRPDSGEVRVNDLDVSEYTAGQLMMHVGLISTRGDIFRGSIRDNITRFGKVPYAQALEVANYLGVYAEIAKLPYGMDTFLSDSILDPVTPGLKQMISILRALASKPHIILFDDADFALDQQNYERIYKLFGSIKQNVAMIIVSQDANLRSIADQHYDLRDGHLHTCERL